MDLNDKNAFTEALLSAAEKNGLSSLLDAEKAELFYQLTLRMTEVGRTMNLTAIKEPEKIIYLHYIDCLLCASFLPQGAKVLDVGAGAGFPSLPLAICRPDLSILALDATAKRVNYVAETAVRLGCGNLSAICERAEVLAQRPTFREQFDCVTSRAVAALPVLCELCLPFVRVGGSLVAMKGKNAEEERSAALRAALRLGGDVIQLTETPIATATGEEYAHTTLLIPKIKATPAAYPRAYAKMLKSPL